MTSRLNVRRLSLLAAVFVLGAILTVGCGDDEADSEASGGGGSGFPVTIEHKYGSTTIPEKPQRIVSVGYSEQDTLLALGIKPVGLRDWYGDYPYSTWPWAQDELGDSKPEIVATAAEIDFEAVAALNPDLIIGLTSGMTKEDYDKLTRIAPTLTQPGEFVDYGMPWREQLTEIGQAVGEPDKAKAVLDRIEARFATVRSDHPEFKGKTTAVAFYFDNQPGAYSSQDGRSRIMTDLGFTIPKTFDELSGENFYTSFSQERFDLLEVNVIVWLSGTDEGLNAIRTMPMRQKMKATAEGREVFADALLGGAFSFGSPLSIDYALDRLVPMLAAAVDGDPKTVVPQ